MSEKKRKFVTADEVRRELYRKYREAASRAEPAAEKKEGRGSLHPDIVPDRLQRLEVRADQEAVVHFLQRSK